jgi:hypothetical protein
MLESHISYPILCYYRSQHDNQSWLSALTTVLDACALLITSIDTSSPTASPEARRRAGITVRQAQLTFAVGRHTLVDLGHVFHRERREREITAAPLLRLPDDEFARLCDLLSTAGFQLCGDVARRDRLLQVRRLYEPHAQALAEYLHLGLPLWSPPPSGPQRRDAWSRVDGLRSPALSTHVSPQSTASHLQDDSSH